MNRQKGNYRWGFPGAVLALGTLMLSGSASWAAGYPTKPIEMIVAYSAGSATDIIARALSASARKVIDQPVVVINKAGGEGRSGMSM